MAYKDKEAQRRYQREWRAQRRARYQDGQACFMCGSIENLELEHRDPLLKLSHRIWSWSTPRIESEIEKCDWVCRPCHELKSLLMDIGLAGHGLTGYRNGCRCDECRQAKTDQDKRSMPWRHRD